MARLEKTMAAGCTGPSMGVEFMGVDQCFSMGAGQPDVKITCSGVNPTATAYTAGAGCATVDTSYAAGGFVNGVHNQEGGCYTITADKEYGKLSCSAEDMMTITQYTDANCGTALAATATGATLSGALECSYEYSKDNDGNFQFPTLGSASKSEVAANGSLMIYSYTDARCSGGKTLVGEVIPNTCFDSDGTKAKWDGTVSTKTSTPVGSSAVVPGSGNNANNTNTTAAPKSTSSNTRLQQRLPMLATLVAASASLF